MRLSWISRYKLVYLRVLRDIVTTMSPGNYGNYAAEVMRKRTLLHIVSIPIEIDSLVVGLSPVEWRDALQPGPNVLSKILSYNLKVVTAQVPGWCKRIR